MAQQHLNLGTGVGTGDGDGLRDAMAKIKANFDEVYPSLAATYAAIATFGQDLTELRDAIDQVAYVPMTVTSFTNTVGTVEIGSTVTSVTFNWTLGKTAASVSINQGVGAVTPPSLTTKTVAVSLTSDTVFTLTADDDSSNTGHAATRTTSVLFQHRMRWGTSAAATLDSEGIATLASSAFATTRARSVVVSGGGQYIYFAYPASFGDAAFTVNGLANSAWTKTLVAFTNASGNTTSYAVWRSNTVQFGSNIPITLS